MAVASDSIKQQPLGKDRAANLAAARASDDSFREALYFLGNILDRQWDLGRQVVVGWCSTANGIEVLFVPNHRLSEALANHQHFLIGSRHVDAETLNRMAEIFGKKPVALTLPAIAGGRNITSADIETVVEKYCIKKVDSRAAVLFDIVKFSIYPPLEQVMQLNNLQYSINFAQSALVQHGINCRTSRSPTGDGFYVWNSKPGLEGDLELFQFMVLVLAENAVAHYKGKGSAVPQLRSCFHIGSNFEYNQVDVLTPTIVNYIVGDLTINMARMIDKAMPGQLLIGSFIKTLSDDAMAQENGLKRINAPIFMSLAQRRVTLLNDLVPSGERVDKINLYLTGIKGSNDNYNVKRYRLRDKHGKSHNVFNAKLNIALSDERKIFIGLRDSDLAEFDAEPSVLDLSGDWEA
jgi:hypothetical protein